ncbi:energy transducer TonB [Methylocella silvestris]|uniref:TonB C-terminal domain-containing protein n=1 Tax=Methylocella silvestris TaxID=199596 RepID=A0A2J7TI17_METSI|nr:energy transducer TonB [Methylocella silvestris]PNG26387.1 hypothetical protein CR492_08235 [Methylocella silvestris]
MSETKARGRSRFTIYHGLAVSLALHCALALPFVLQELSPAPDEPEILVVELQGVIADTQSEQKTLQETKGAAQQEAAEAGRPAQAVAAPAEPPPPEDQPKDDPAREEVLAAPPVPTTIPPPPDAAPPQPSQGAGANTSAGAEERSAAQRIRMERDAERDRLKAYVKRLTKRVQAHLAYPDEERQAGLQGAATVSFTILPGGAIRPETLKIISTSGQPKLDASALKTIRLSGPFDPPPREMTVALAVAFGRRR